MTKTTVAAVSRQRRVTLPCDTCGFRREVSWEHAHQVKSGNRPNVCRSCRREERRERHDPVEMERHMRFWLTTFGAPARTVNAMTAAGYVREHGLPPAFAEIVDLIDPRR